MKNTTKVVLLSALAFPGAGHLLLKHTKRGVVLFIVFCALIYPVIDYTYHQTLSLLEQIIAGQIAPTASAMQDFLSNNKHDSQLINTVSYALLILWFIGMIDSYRLAKLTTK